MPPLSVPFLHMILVCAVPLERPIENESVDPRVRLAIERSTGFLDKEGLRWMQKQQCASCHHIPAMVWALNEARNHGYRINETTLAEVTTWALAEGSHSQVFPDLPLDKKRTETDYLGPLLLALGVGASHDNDSSLEKARRRLLAHAASQQAKDGSWHANSGGRPPVHASKDVQTSWLSLAMSGPADGRGAEDPWQAQRNAAAEWLTQNPPADSHQALAMRLLVHQRLARSAGDARPLLESLLRQQNEDGGWSQTKKMKSDAFATGLALYVLSGQRAPGVDAAIRRAHVFLIKTQQTDGSWPMTSRAAEPKGPGPAHDLRPIQYFGTAWATIGLVRSSSGSGAGEASSGQRPSSTGH
jgi:squalene-hopene/tetraprenyl-beta-curcumene cyclase